MEIRSPAINFAKFRQISPLLIDPKLLNYNTVQDFNPQLTLVDPSILYVDERYQRNVSRKSSLLIKKIVREWSWLSFKPPIVTKDVDINGKETLFVIDGQHTSIAAATHPEIKQIPIFLVDAATLQERAKAFIEHNTNQTRVSDIQLFKASLEAGDEDAISINMALQNSGVKLSQLGNLENKEGYCTCVGTLKKVYNRYGMRALRITLDICVAAKLTPIQSHYVNSVADIMFGKKNDIVYDAQALALTIRNYPYIDLISDIEKHHRTNKISKNRSAFILIQNKYKNMFGDVDDS